MNRVHLRFHGRARTKRNHGDLILRADFHNLADFVGRVGEAHGVWKRGRMIRLAVAVVLANHFGGGYALSSRDFKSWMAPELRALGRANLQFEWSVS